MPPSGQYVSNKFKPAVAFEVGQDWYLVPQEKPGLVMFETGPDPVRLGDQLIFTNPLIVFDPSNLSEPKELPEPENDKEWVSWFQSHPNLDTSKPVPVSVGSASGMRIDVTDSSMPENFPRDLCGREPCVPLFRTDESITSDYGGGKAQYVIVDVGGETVIIYVAAPADKFDEVLPKAQAVLDSVEWKGENSGHS
jgi:hypothetical protein